MKNIKFSVLMSVYYKENPDYLDKSLESIFNQTVLPSEVILVEDGKLPAELDEIIRKYYKMHKHILKVIKYKKNKGLGIALHNGLEKCSNEIVFRMDSDDVSVKKRFEETLRIFNKINVDVVGSNIAEYDEKMEQITGYKDVPEKNDDIIRTMKKRNPLNHMTVAYKKSKVIESGNYMHMPFFEDYFLWARMCSNNCKFYNIQDVLVNVRGGSSMIKRRGGKHYIKPIINFQRELLKLNIISKTEYLENIIVRTLVCFMPSKVRAFFYNQFLRKKKRI